jgi:hypothetical protein
MKYMNAMMDIVQPVVKYINLKILDIHGKPLGFMFSFELAVELTVDFTVVLVALVGFGAFSRSSCSAFILSEKNDVALRPC